MLKMKHKKMHKYLKSLLNEKTIKFERFEGGDKKWGFYPTPMKELINWDEWNKDETKRKNIV